MEYLLVIHPAEEGGYWADVPSLPGCFAQGETLEEAITEGREAIVAHLHALREDGQPVPQEQQVIVATISIPEAASA